MTGTPKHPPLTSLEEALIATLPSLKVLGHETIALDDPACDGRLVCHDVVSRIEVPAFNNSMMDGFALCASHWQGKDKPLPIVGRVAAGESPPHPLKAHSAMRIFTGAPLPEGADCVVMQESCRIEDGLVFIEVQKPPCRGDSVNKAGQDINAGAVVVKRHTRLNPATIGLLASVGYGSVQVAKRPRIALISTGSELVMPTHVAEESVLEDAPTLDLPLGKIYNSNPFVIAPMVQRWGGVVLNRLTLPDHHATIRQALCEAAKSHDLIITTGGASVGEEDHIQRILHEEGAMSLWRLAIKPGKPLAFGHMGSCPLVGLPGNPVAATIVAALFVRPLLMTMQGIEAQVACTLPFSWLPADFDWPQPDKIRREFIRVYRVEDRKASHEKSPQSAKLTLYPNQKSGILSSVASTDGFLDNPAGQVIRKGDLCRFIAYQDLLMS